MAIAKDSLSPHQVLLKKLSSGEHTDGSGKKDSSGELSNKSNNSTSSKRESFRMKLQLKETLVHKFGSGS